MEKPNSDIILYSTSEGEIKVEVYYEDETFWLSQKRMSILFDVDIRTISEHLQNIFGTGELEDKSVIRKFRITASDGKKYNTNFYNLDAVIAVGYRVNSYQATQFRVEKDKKFMSDFDEEVKKLKKKK